MNPKVVAATIAGSGIGFSAGFLSKSEELENNGNSFWSQIGGGLKSGVKDSIIGSGAILAPYGVYKAISVIK